MKIRRKVLPVTIIELTDEGLCRMANWSPICCADMPTSNEYRRWVVIRVLPHWVNSSLTDGHAYVTYGSTIWELVGTRIQYKFEILVVFLVGMDII